MVVFVCIGLLTRNCFSAFKPARTLGDNIIPPAISEEDLTKSRRFILEVEEFSEVIVLVIISFLKQSTKQML